MGSKGFKIGHGCGLCEWPRAIRACLILRQHRGEISAGGASGVTSAVIFRPMVYHFGFHRGVIGALLVGDEGSREIAASGMLR